MWWLGRRRRRALALTLGALLALSLAVSIRWTAVEPSYAFFATPTRGWEFAAGGLVALLGPATRHRGLIAVAGFVGITASFALISGSDPFPGWVALAPVLSAAAVLAADAGHGARAPFGVAPVRWLGDASYSVYLWHWPLLIGAPWVLHHSPGALDRVVLLAATGVLAEASRRFVEDPVRRRARGRRREVPAYAFAAVGILVLALATSLTARQERSDHAAAVARLRTSLDHREAAAVAGADVPSVAPARRAGPPPLPVSHSCFGAGAMLDPSGCPDRFTRPADLDTAFAAQDGPTWHCLQDRGVRTPSWCTFGDTVDPVRTVAVIGNSHARRLVPALDLYGRQHRWKILVATEIDCMGLTTQPVGDLTGGDGCLAWSAAVQHRLLTTSGLNAVIFASHVDARDYMAGLNASASAVRAASAQAVQAWRTLTAHGVTVIVTGDVPGMRPAADPDCLAQSTVAVDPCSVPRNAVVRSNLMTRLAQQHPGLARYLPLTPYFCDQRCHAIIGGVVVYYDSHHMTDTFSRSLAPYLGVQLASLIG